MAAGRTHSSDPKKIQLNKLALGRRAQYRNNHKTISRILLLLNIHSGMYKYKKCTPNQRVDAPHATLLAAAFLFTEHTARRRILRREKKTPPPKPNFFYISLFLWFFSSSYIITYQLLSKYLPYTL